MKNKKLIIRLLDEVNCTLFGLSPEDINILYKDFSLFKEGAQFSPKYKLGVWDGRVHFFHKTGKTFITLLDDIVPKVKKMGYAIEINDRRTAVTVFPDPIDENYLEHCIHPRTGLPTKLEPHQVEMINTMFEEGSGLAIAATGFGKTLACAVMVDVYGHHGLKCIVIVPDKTLVRQTRDGFVNFGVDTGIYYGDEKDTKHLHLISTWQSLQNATALLHDYQVVIIDEAHGAKASVIAKLLNEDGKHIAHRFGMTGTLPKDTTDLMSIRSALGEVKFTHKAARLIETNWLSNLHIDIVQIETDLSIEYEKYIDTQNPVPAPTYAQFKRSYFPDWQAEKSYLQKDKNRLQYIADDIYRSSKDEKGNTLLLVNGVDVGKRIAALIPDAYFVYGADQVEEREKVYKLFQTENNLVVIATMHIAAVGLDIPRIFNFCLLDFGKSFVKTIQSIGRGLRKATDKDFVNVKDYCSDLKYGVKHRNERVSYYKEQEYPYTIIKINLSKI